MNGPTKNDLHERAASSAREARGSIIRLAAAFIGGLVFVTARGFDPPLDVYQKVVILSAMGLMGLAFGLGIFVAWADAQWSYSWGYELDVNRSTEERARSREDKLRWRARKAQAERLMLGGFILGVFFSIAFVILRCF